MRPAVPAPEELFPLRLQAGSHAPRWREWMPSPQQTGSFQVPLGGLGLTQQPPAWDQGRAGSGLSLKQGGDEVWGSR